MVLVWHVYLVANVVQIFAAFTNQGVITISGKDGLSTADLQPAIQAHINARICMVGI